jgi:Nucleotidyltransferase domain
MPAGASSNILGQGRSRLDEPQLGADSGDRAQRCLARGRSVKRDRATQLLEDMLQRLVEGGEWLDLVDDVYVFGSYARGAPEPGDVDVAVEYTPDHRAGAYVVRALATGADCYAPLRQALRGKRRGLQFAFQVADLLARESGFELVHIYHRGDALEDATARLHAIAVDPAAGQSERDAMQPEFVGLDKWLILPIRRALIDLQDRGAIKVHRVELADRVPAHRRVQRVVDMRWHSQDSPARRAACAALARLEDEGVDLMTVRIGDAALGDQPPVHVVSWTLQRLNLLPQWIRDSQGQWLHVANPSRGKPMSALRFSDPVAEQVREGDARLVD